MPLVQFIYTGQLATAAGLTELSLEIDSETTVAEAVKHLAERHGAAFGSLTMTSAGRLRPTLLVALDGVQASGDRETRALDGVRSVMLMTPIAGG